MKKNFYDKNSVESKAVQKIITSKKAIELKYSYKGETKNNVPHTPNGYGEKEFEFVDKALEEYQRKQVGKRPPISIMDLGLDEAPPPSKPNYDLELLRDYAQNTYTREFFDSCGQRITELAEYKNGKPHGAVHLTIGIDGLDYEHNFFCFFKDGVPDGNCIYYEPYMDDKIFYTFTEGNLLSRYSIESMETDNVKKILKEFKSNKILWDCIYNKYLDSYFENLLYE
ncbi:hypothetical protein OAJ30_03910 [Alphaproteobacteria bacterium]|nr:hypothetical protein [Alphaproteobacteria bacterium]